MALVTWERVNVNVLVSGGSLNDVKVLGVKFVSDWHGRESWRKKEEKNEFLVC